METIGHSVRASIDFSGPLNALATSPNKRLIAVGGRDVLKIVAFEASGFTERRNLRAGKTNLSFTTNDIRWHPHSDSLVATAATNGHVVIWNLQKDGFKNVQERVFSGHKRAVNRICWHPTDGNLLLSGSQDGTIKLWDTRGNVATTYLPKCEPVRDVRVTPFQPNKFAAAFENGIIQIWDTRKNAQPELKFQAHKGLVLTLDWHPSSPHVLASGGRDRYVKVWDLGDVSKPRQTIQTIASVGRVAWRPTCPDHIATSASVTDNAIHVWDIQHPWIPIASMKDHSDIASGVEWLDTPASLTFGMGSDAQAGEWEGLDYWQHTLACSKDGTLKLHSLADAFKPHQSLPTTALALNSRGQVAFSHDYIDRSCASLKIHRHFNLASSLFTVTDAASAATTQKFTNSPYGSFIADAEEDSHSVHRGVSRTQPPLAPKGPSASSYGTPLNGGGGGSSGALNQAASGILRHSGATSTTLPSQGSGGDDRRYRYPSTTSSAASSTTSSPIPSFFGGGGSGSSSPNPRAVIALVSMQNVHKASELEAILHGDDDAFWLAHDRLELLQQQFGHVALLKDAFGFDEQVFRFLATQYVFVDEAMSFSDKCAHNALAAFVAGSAQLSQMWRVLDVLFTGDSTSVGGHAHSPDDSQDHSRSGPLDIRHLMDGELLAGDHHHHHHHHHNQLEDSQHSVSRREAETDELSSTTSSMMVGVHGHPHNGGGAAGTTHTAMLLQQLDHVNPQAMHGFDPYPYDPQHGAGRGITTTIAATTAAAPGSNTIGSSSLSNSKLNGKTAISNGSAVFGEISHLRAAMVKDLLEYYVDIGDLQTAVAVAFVVNSVLSVEDIVGKSWLQQICMHYIELLHQLRLYQAANELILHCTDASIRQMNQRSTSVYFNCANCTKPCETTLNADGEPVNPYLCTNCSNPTTRCSICRLPVRGLYVWCPVCSHGGHLEHLADWFREEEFCPTGCSHRCSFNFGDARHHVS